MADPCLDYFGAQLKDLVTLNLLGPFNVTKECFVRFFQTIGDQLTEFTVGDTARFNIEAYEALVDNCPNLEILRLKTLKNIDDASIRLLTGLTNLKVLEISNPCQTITDGPIIDILNSCGSGLTELNLNGCQELTDATIAAIHETCGSLQILALEELDQVTDEVIANLFSNWSVNPGLSHLNLGRVWGLGNVGFNRMVDHNAHSLEFLSLNSCREVDAEGWEYFCGKKFPRLEELNVGFVRSVNDVILERVVEVAPELKTVKVWGNPRVTEAINGMKGIRLVGREADILA